MKNVTTPPWQQLSRPGLCWAGLPPIARLTRSKGPMQPVNGPGGDSKAGPLRMSQFFSDMQLGKMAEQFDRNGYLLVERALTDEQVARFNDAVDHHLKAWPDDWVELSDSFRE